MLYYYPTNCFITKKFEENVDNDILFKALNSEIRQSILLLLAKEGELTAIDVYRKVSTREEPVIGRDTIYRHLELLTQAKLLKKEYNYLDKKLKYSLAIKALKIKFLPNEISVEIEPN